MPRKQKLPKHSFVILIMKQQTKQTGKQANKQRNKQNGQAILHFQSQGHIKNGLQLYVASLMLMIADSVVKTIQRWFIYFVNSLWPCSKVKVMKTGRSI